MKTYPKISTLIMALLHDNLWSKIKRSSTECVCFVFDDFSKSKVNDHCVAIIVKKDCRNHKSNAVSLLQCY